MNLLGEVESDREDIVDVYPRKLRNILFLRVEAKWATSQPHPYMLKN